MWDALQPYRNVVVEADAAINALNARTLQVIGDSITPELDALRASIGEAQGSVDELIGNNFAEDLAGKLTKDQNLNDLPDKGAARTALELGTMATKTATDYLARAGGTLIGTLSVKAVDETVVALPGTTPALSITAAQVFTLTTSGNTTLSITDAPTDRAWARTLYLTMGGAHLFDITGALWGDDGAPDLASGDFLKIQLDGVGTTFSAAVAWRATA